jgi:hypothetical protein
MADPAAMRTALGRLGFNAQGQAAIANDDNGGQGLNIIADIQMMNDSDVESMCASIRRPGGTVDDGHGNQVPNRGQNISVIQEKKLKLMVYFTKHKKRCSEACTHALITADSVEAMRSLYEDEKAHKNPEVPVDPKSIIDVRDWHKTFETLDEHIGKHRGIDGVPLTYLIRDNHTPTPNPAGGWTDETLRMVARAPHFQVNAAGVVQAEFCMQYKNDNKMLWNIISGLTRDITQAWAYVKVGKRQTDGRGAYLKLKGYYLGQHYQEAQQGIHENKLRALQYHGESRKMTFARYSTSMFESIQALNSMKESGYQGVDDRTAVRHLLDGIKDSSLDATKNSILASEQLRTSYDGCVALFLDFIAQKATSDKKLSLNISDVDSKKQGKEKGKRPRPKGQKGESGVEFRYYKTKEYNTLTPDQKEELRQWRKNRDGKKSDDDKQPLKKKQKTSHVAEMVTAATTAAIQALNISATTSTKDGEEEKGVTFAPGTVDNSTNPALSRQTGARLK